MGMKILLVMLMAGTLTACGRVPNARINPVNVAYMLPGGVEAREFQLNDGTRCVAYSHGITCEWQRPVVLVPQVQ
jgi:hypothetical protein